MAIERIEPQSPEGRASQLMELFPTTVVSEQTAKDFKKAIIKALLDERQQALEGFVERTQTTIARYERRSLEKQNDDPTMYHLMQIQNQVLKEFLEHQKQVNWIFQQGIPVPKGKNNV